jgi:hypothetical protein
LIWIQLLAILSSAHCAQPPQPSYFHWNEADMYLPADICTCFFSAWNTLAPDTQFSCYSNFTEVSVPNGLYKTVVLPLLPVSRLFFFIALVSDIYFILPISPSLLSSLLVFKLIFYLFQLKYNIHKKVPSSQVNAQQLEQP